jgi:acyl-CoA thioesterase II
VSEPAVGDPVTELLGALDARPEPGRPDRFEATAPDWFGDRVFGGVVVAQGLAAACRSVDDGLVAHSLHASFLGALRPGPVALAVDRLRDGRTFTTRHVTSEQGGRTALWMTVSFHRTEEGDEYQRAVPTDVPPPEDVAPAEYAPPPFEVREIGPTEPDADGTFRSTRRCWVRTVAPLPDDPVAHLLVAAFLSDMTGTSFRPLRLDTWGTHTDASIDHAAWFHRPFRLDDWVYCDFEPVVNTAGRAAVRGLFYDAAGRLCLSMAQELLIRPLDVPLEAPVVGL